MFARVDWGSVGEWVSGIGSLAAVATAVVVVLYQVRATRREARRQQLAVDARGVIDAAADLVAVMGRLLQRVRVFRARYPSINRRLVLPEAASEMLRVLDGHEEDLARSLAAQFRIQALTRDAVVLGAVDDVMSVMWRIQSYVNRPARPSDDEWDTITEEGIGRARTKLVEATRHLVSGLELQQT